MDDIKGATYKLAGIEVVQKGTLVDVFAKFARLDETLKDITATKAPRKVKSNAPAGSLAATLAKLPPLPRSLTLPTLSVEDITDAIVGKRDIAPSEGMHLQVTDKRGVIADLGSEKLAQVLVKMGEARKQVLNQNVTTFVPMMAPVRKR